MGEMGSPGHLPSFHDHCLFVIVVIVSCFLFRCFLLFLGEWTTRGNTLLVYTQMVEVPVSALYADPFIIFKKCQIVPSRLFTILYTPLT